MNPTPSPAAVVRTPSLHCRNRLSSGDSRNFSIAGRIFSEIFSNSRAVLTSAILAARARPISCRALAAESVMASARRIVERTPSSSAPQLLQNLLGPRSSIPQFGQYIASKQSYENHLRLFPLCLHSSRCQGETGSIKAERLSYHHSRCLWESCIIVSKVRDRSFRSEFMSNKESILERLVTLGNEMEENLASLQAQLEKRGDTELELRLVREIQQDFVLRRALLRRLQERFERFAAPDLINQIFDRLEE